MKAGVALVVALVVILGLLLTPAEAQRTNPVQDVTITVTAANSEEVLSFEAAILRSEDGPELEIVRANTPHRIKIRARVLTALFKRTSGTALLHVEVEYESHGYSRGKSSGSAEAIIVGQNLVERDSSFIRGL